MEPCDRPGGSQEQWVGEGELSESPLGWVYGTLRQSRVQEGEICVCGHIGEAWGHQVESRLG